MVRPPLEHEPGGHDADDLVRPAVDPHGAPDDVGPGGKAAVPERVADHDHVVARSIFVSGERAPELRRYAEHRKQAVRDAQAEHLFGLGFAGEVEGENLPDRHSLEGTVLPLPVFPVRLRHDVHVGGIVSVRFPRHDEPFRLGKRERTQVEVVDDAEQRRVASDPDRQREDGDDAERRPGSEQPCGVDEIAHEGGERIPPCRRRRHGRRGAAAPGVSRGAREGRQVEHFLFDGVPGVVVGPSGAAGDPVDLVEVLGHFVDHVVVERTAAKAGADERGPVWSVVMHGGSPRRARARE